MATAMAAIGTSPGALQFQPTPCQVAIAALIKIYVTDDSFSMHLKQELIFFLIKQIKGVDGYVEKSLLEIQSAIQSQLKSPERSLLATRLVENLFQLESPDDLLNFMQELKPLLTSEPTRETNSRVCSQVHSSSILGIFLRRVILSFQKLMFEGISRLYTNMQSFLRAYSSRDAARFCSYVTPIQAENIIYEQAQMLENANPALVAATLNSANHDLNELMRIYPSLEKVHYLLFLQALANKDREGAFDHLHRYFDYHYCRNTSTMQQQQADGNKNSNNNNTTALLASYAVLNLAAVHYRFGHYRSAIQAIHETVRMAHQNNEHECLALALSLLFKLANAEGSVSEAQWLLQRCVTQSNSLKMAALLSQTLLARAESLSLSLPLLGNNSNNNDRTNLNEGSRNNSNNGGSRHGLVTPAIEYNNLAPLPIHVARDLRRSAKINAESALPTLAKTSILTRSTAWETFGNREMAIRYADSVLVASKSSGTSADAWWKIATGGPSYEDKLLALCKKANSLAKEGEYASALETLVGFSEAKGDPMWIKTVCDIIFDRALRRCEFQKARTVLTKLAEVSIADGNSTSNFAIVADALNRKAQLLLRTGCFKEATDVARKCIEICKGANLQTECVRHQLLLADIHLAAGTPLIALHYILTCITTCEDAYLQSLRAASLLRLAQYQLQSIKINGPKSVRSATAANNRVRALLEESSLWPHVLQNGTAEQRGMMYHLMAQCYINVFILREEESRLVLLANSSSSSNNNNNTENEEEDIEGGGEEEEEDQEDATPTHRIVIRKEQAVEKAIEFLHNARSEFEKIDALEDLEEIYWSLANMYNNNNNKSNNDNALQSSMEQESFLQQEERNRYATMFIETQRRKAAASSAASAGFHSTDVSTWALEEIASSTSSSSLPSGGGGGITKQQQQQQQQQQQHQQTKPEATATNSSFQQFNEEEEEEEDDDGDVIMDMDINEDNEDMDL